MNEADLGRQSGVMQLENGLRITFYDQSRPVAGDRSFVQLLIHIPVPLEQDYCTGSAISRADWDLFASAARGEVAFVQTKSRNFVPTSEAPTILEILKEEFLQANLAYLSKPSFPRLFALKEYEAWKKTSAWGEAHRRQILAAEQKERESE